MIWWVRPFPFSECDHLHDPLVLVVFPAILETVFAAATCPARLAIADSTSLELEGSQKPLKAVEQFGLNAGAPLAAHRLRHQ